MTKAGVLSEVRDQPATACVTECTPIQCNAFSTHSITEGLKSKYAHAKIDLGGVERLLNNQKEKRVESPRKHVTCVSAWSKT